MNSSHVKKTDLHKSERNMARLFIALPVIGFCIFTLVTLVFVFVFSLMDYNVYREEYSFIGFQNFTDLFSNEIYSDAFFRAIGNTMFMLLGVPVGMVVGLGLSALLQAKAMRKCSKVFQVLFYLPAVTSAVAINLVFRYLFNPSYGLINKMLGTEILWFSNEWLIKIAIMIKNTWAGMGGTMILCLAGMLSIPSSYYEAADIDGAKPGRKFFSITLPLITPTLFYMLITGIIGGLQSYADAQVFANGASGAQTIVYFIWQYGINQGKQGLASAGSLVLAVFIMIVTFIQFKISNKWVYEA